jgi:hypothetical protein
MRPDDVVFPPSEPATLYFSPEEFPNGLVVKEKEKNND